MKRILIFISILFISVTSHAQSTLTQTVKGIITDEQSGNVMSSVTVTLEGFKNTMSDSAGFFKIQKVPIGRQNLIITYVGYEDAVMKNIEVTSSKEVVLEITLKEKIKKLDQVIITTGKQKTKALNESAVVSARQFSVEEAVRYAGSRSDPSRMAQNYAGVSGSNDARNDIVIRGNSPSGVLWRMDGIDIPNPNHYSTLGSTGGPVTILNTNTLKNSDFLTSAFPAQYGNALAGVFDLRMRNGNSEKYEFLGQMGFNGFEFGAEGPLKKNSGASFLVNYRYSLVAAIQKLGLNVGTGSATPYYQDAEFRLHIPSKKAGTFDWFGIGGESHILFPHDDDKDNLYGTNDGSVRDRNFKSLTGVTGLTHTYFYNPQTSGKITLAVSAFKSVYDEQIVESDKPLKKAFDKNHTQMKYSAGYIFNKKINSKNSFTASFAADFNTLNLNMDQIKDGDSVLSTFIKTKENATLLKGFVNYYHRFTDKLSTNIGLYYHQFTLNDSKSMEPRWNLKYQFQPNQSFSLGAGLHSQLQPLEIYFYQSRNTAGQIELTNKNLDFVKSIHTVLGYDNNFSKHLRLKAELYGQFIYNAAVESAPSSFSLLNAGAGFYFPDKTNLVNKGKGYNYGVELTLERFLDKGLYFLITASIFESKYKGSDNVWRNTAFNSNYVTNVLGGKEFKLGPTSSLGIDTKITLTGGQRYTPFDIITSKAAGFVVLDEAHAYNLQNATYWRWDLKFSYNRNGKKTTQKWYVDFQNITNRKNIYVRTLNPKTSVISEINQMGFFPNINYQITF